MSPRAKPGTPVLGGVQLETSPDDWRILPRSARTVERLATLGVRQWVLALDPALPEVPRVREFALAWSNLRDPGAVRRLVARPTVHTLVLWRTEELTWRSDGERTLYRLPNGWTPAVDAAQAVPAPGLDPGKWEMQIRLEPTGEPLPLTVLDAASFEAGSPPAGDVWRERGTGRFRLGEAPAAGEGIWGSVVPVYRVVQAQDEAEIQVSRPLVEPHELRLLEAPVTSMTEPST